MTRAEFINNINRAIEAMNKAADGQDAYRIGAASYLGIPPEDVTAKQRHLWKNLTFLCRGRVS